MFQDLCKEIRKEPDPKKWDYGDIGNKINLKLDENLTKRKQRSSVKNILLKSSSRPPGRLLAVIENPMLIKRMIQKRKKRKHKLLRKPRK